MRSMNRSVLTLAAALALGFAGWSATLAQDGRQPAATRIATADVLGIVERMLASDRYRPAQESFLKQENDKLRPLADELAAMETRGNNLAPGSPDLERLGREFDEKQQAFQRAREEAFTRIEAFNADQVREAYRLTLAAVDQVSDQLGYTHVLSTRTGDATIRSQNVPGALQEILARPVAKASQADDLTDRLIRQLRLENVKLEDPNAPSSTNAPARAPLPPTR